MSETLKYKDYIASIQFSDEDNIFFGKILGINDLVMFEGSSVQELRQAFIDAVEEYLETCKKVNKEPDKTYKGSFNVRVTPELHRKAAIYAAQKNISLNDFVKQAIEFTLINKDRVSPIQVPNYSKEGISSQYSMFSSDLICGIEAKPVCYTSNVGEKILAGQSET